MFSESERQIYPLRRAGQDVHVDPMTVWRAISAELDGTEQAPIIQQAGETDPRVRLDALGRLARVAQAAFGFAPISPDGTSGDTESHAIDTLYRFFAWEADQKKDLVRTPNGSPPLASSPDPSTT